MIKPAFLLAAATLAATLAAPARADCFDDAARYQHVNPWTLRAIAWQESHYRPEALHKNDNGSVDYGMMQINSIHLPTLARYGISSGTLMDPCKNVYIAAWHLRQKMDKHGNSWDAVGAYHSETPELRDKYKNDIIAILVRWKVLTAPTAETAAGNAAIVPRAGTATRKVRVTKVASDDSQTREGVTAER
jgi:soluble lytic murein transglycosylase-like protein